MAPFVKQRPLPYPFCLIQKFLGPIIVHTVQHALVCLAEDKS